MISFSPNKANKNQKYRITTDFAKPCSCLEIMTKTGHQSASINFVSEAGIYCSSRTITAVCWSPFYCAICTQGRFMSHKVKTELTCPLVPRGSSFEACNVWNFVFHIVRHSRKIKREMWQTQKQQKMLHFPLLHSVRNTSGNTSNCFKITLLNNVLSIMQCVFLVRSLNKQVQKPALCQEHWRKSCNEKNQNLCNFQS